MFKFLLLTIVTAFEKNCSDNIFENTNTLTIEKCNEINNDLISMTFPFSPKNMSLLNNEKILCDSKYQPNTVIVTRVNEKIMYFPSIYEDNNVSLRYFYDCQYEEDNCNLLILNIDNNVIYQDLKISFFFYMTLFCIVFSAIIISVSLYVLPITIICCKSSEFLVSQMREGIIYQFIFIGIICFCIFFNKYFEYIKNKYLYSSNIYDFLKIYYGITLN